jgi:hypothetical protein
MHNLLISLFCFWWNLHDNTTDYNICDWLLESDSEGKQQYSTQVLLMEHIRGYSKIALLTSKSMAPYYMIYFVIGALKPGLTS